MWEYNHMPSSDEIYHAVEQGYERQNHRYVQRIQLPGGGYRYVYPEDLANKAKNKAIAIGSKVKTKAKVASDKAKTRYYTYRAVREMNKATNEARRALTGEKTMGEKVKDAYNRDKQAREEQYQKYKKKQDTIKKVKAPINEAKATINNIKKNADKAQKKRKRDKALKPVRNAEKKVKKMLNKSAKNTKKSITNGYNKTRYYLENRNK